MHIEIIPLVPQFVLYIHGIFLLDVVQIIAQLVSGFGETIYFDDLDNTVTVIGTGTSVVVRRDTSSVSVSVHRGGLGHTGKNLVINIDNVFLIQNKTLAYITHMGRVLAVSNEIEQGVAQYIVGVVDIDGHRNRRRLFLNFIVCDVFRGVGQIAFDVLQFIGVFFHEKVHDYRGVFEDKFYHTGGNKHINNRKHIFVRSLSGGPAVSTHIIYHEHGHHIRFQRFHHIVIVRHTHIGHGVMMH
jgi:hypothetical protein